MVLADVEDWNRFALRARSVDPVMSKCLSDRVEFIQELIASDPKCARAVLEKRVNVDAAQTIGNTRLVLKHFELVAIVAIQTILGPKPHKALIVLHNLPYHGLRQTIFCGEPRETDILTVD